MSLFFFCAIKIPVSCQLSSKPGTSLSHLESLKMIGTQIIVGFCQIPWPLFVRYSVCIMISLYWWFTLSCSSLESIGLLWWCVSGQVWENQRATQDMYCKWFSYDNWFWRSKRHIFILISRCILSILGVIYLSWASPSMSLCSLDWCFEYYFSKDSYESWRNRVGERGIWYLVRT